MSLRKLCVLGLLACGVWLVSSCAAGGGGNDCGNGICQSTETSFTCPQDCGGSTCPNGICDIGENATNCSADCGGAICGNALCEASENTVTCPVDCYCPNNTCDSGESAVTCPADCGGGTCGNSICEASESVTTCPADCSSNPVCGNSICEAGEATSCPADCTTTPVCGDGTCDAGEDSASCPADCGCVDVVCDLYPQCGCSGAQKCTLDSANNNACMTAGSTQAGGTCAGDAECAVGSLCIGRNNAGTEGQCLAYCDPDTQAGCTGATSYCLELSSGGVPIDDAGICSFSCEPHNPSGVCPSGFSCEIYTHNITQVSFTDCHADVGSGTYLTECDPTAGPYCAVGYGCFNDGPPNHCYQWCVPGSSCATGTCDTAAFNPPLSVGGTTYGVCR